MVTAYYNSVNTMVVTLKSTTGVLVTTGVGTITIVDRLGNVVGAPDFFPQSLVNNGDGTYSYTIPADLGLVLNRLYEARITFTAPQDHYAVCVFKVVIDNSQ